METVSSAKVIDPQKLSLTACASAIFLCKELTTLSLDPLLEGRGWKLDAVVLQPIMTEV